MPSTSLPDALIAAFWDDISPEKMGEIYYYVDSLNNKFIVEWEAACDYGEYTPNTFQAIIYEDGRIKFQYKDMQGDLDGCTVGIEDHLGLGACLAAYNIPFVKNDFAVEFVYTPEWLSFDASSGTVPSQGTNQVTAICNATGLDWGTYNADIQITSNDPDEPSVLLPTTFEVIPDSSPISKFYVE